jgi:hypothetical protein
MSFIDINSNQAIQRASIAFYRRLLKGEYNCMVWLQYLFGYSKQEKLTPPIKSIFNMMESILGKEFVKPFNSMYTRTSEVSFIITPLCMILEGMRCTYCGWNPYTGDYISDDQMRKLVRNRSRDVFIYDKPRLQGITNNDPMYNETDVTYEDDRVNELYRSLREIL